MSDKVLENIVKYVETIDSITKVVLFGSRARGDNHDRSDYDIAIWGNLAEIEFSRVEYALKNKLNTLHKIDVVFIDRRKISVELLNDIEKDGVIIYDKEK